MTTPTTQSHDSRELATRFNQSPLFTTITEAELNALRARDWTYTMVATARDTDSHFHHNNIILGDTPLQKGEMPKVTVKLWKNGHCDQKLSRITPLDQIATDHPQFALISSFSKDLQEIRTLAEGRTPRHVDPHHMAHGTLTVQGNRESRGFTAFSG